ATADEAIAPVLEGLGDHHIPVTTSEPRSQQNPDNVPLYEHFGYRLVGHEHVGDIETWGLFREDS
ncbi:MAG: hypothetical protein OES47_13100, partial [Acidobacteriota bacterium]|nr:hypothetical protein [Acidobacteriota bacterium]